MLSPDKPALQILDGDVWTYAQLRQAVMDAASGFAALGLKSSSKVLIRMGNRVEFPIAYLGCIWAGFIPVPTSAQLTRAEITKISDDLSPDLILFENAVSCPDSSAQTLSLIAFRSFPKDKHVEPIMGDPDRLAYIIYTSGTSGKAKGVCHAHRAIWARRMMFEGWYGLRVNDRVLHAGAFNWSYTMGTGLMDPWTVGATALIPSADMDVDALAGHIHTSRPSIFAAAPGVYRKLLKSKSLTTSGYLRHGLSAGEALPQSLRTAWRDHMGCDIHEALGMSECSTFISGVPADPAPTGMAGRPQAGRTIAVVSDGETVPINTPGTLAVHRSDPGLMLGYLGDPTPLPEWFLTGDTVSMNSDGWITYLGRNDDILTAGGFRISPLEVEQAFSEFKEIDECAAVSVQLNADTTVVALFYSAKSDVNEQDLCDHAHKMLAPYKQPRLYIPHANLPKGANGKLNRRPLRDNFEVEP